MLNELFALKDQTGYMLKKLIANEKESSTNVDRFLRLVHNYTNVKELTAEIIREFVEKIYVHQMAHIRTICRRVYTQVITDNEKSA